MEVKDAKSEVMKLAESGVMKLAQTICTMLFLRTYSSVKFYDL